MSLRKVKSASRISISVVLAGRYRAAYPTFRGKAVGPSDPLAFRAFAQFVNTREKFPGVVAPGMPGNPGDFHRKVARSEEAAGRKIDG